MNDIELAYKRGYADGRRDAEQEIAYQIETIGRLVIELAAVKKERDEKCIHCGYKYHSKECRSFTTAMTAGKKENANMSRGRDYTAG